MNKRVKIVGAVSWGLKVATHRSDDELAELGERAAALRGEGVGAKRIAQQLGISHHLTSELLRGVPVPASLMRLRSDGWLLREIAEELGVSAKTVHWWCRGIPVPARASHGRSPEEACAMNRARWDVELARREEARQFVIDGHRSRVGVLDDLTLDLVVATAYWCEGSKSKPWRRSEFLQFINSDPDLIHESGDLAAATEFWAAVVGCDVSVFAKPLIKHHNPVTVRKNVGESYRGCLAIGVRQSRVLYQEIEGLWRGIVEGSRRAFTNTAD